VLFLWYLLIGVSTGMRTLTATAVLCWCAWLAVIPQSGWASWSGNLVSVIVFSLMAIGEYWGDTRPTAPNRTSPPALLARFAFGGLAGALAASGIDQPLMGGILFALFGVLVGAFGGMRLRLWASARLGRDLPAALSESAVALLLAVCAAVMLHFELSIRT
jgi:uncharacterized membrane protein